MVGIYATIHIAAVARVVEYRVLLLLLLAARRCSVHRRSRLVQLEYLLIDVLFQLLYL